MSKVISLSLFHSSDPNKDMRDYETATRLAVHTSQIVFPRWKVIVCTDYRDLKLEGAYIIQLPKPPNRVVGQLWRWIPVWEWDASYVFMRDVDALPMSWDRRACEEFIVSGYDFHTQSCTVTHNAMVLAGLSGVRCAAMNALYPSWDAFMEGGTFEDRRGEEQPFIERRVWNLLLNSAMTHRISGIPSYGEAYRCYKPTIPIPSDIDPVYLERIEEISPFPGTPYDMETVETRLGNLKM